MAKDRHEERLIKAREDEARLEAEMFGSAGQEELVLDNGDVVAPEGPTEFEAKLTDEALKDVIIPEDTLMNGTDEVVATLRKELSDSQHRYNRYKGSTDRTLFQLRSENATLNKRIVQLRSEIVSSESVNTVPEEDIFTQDVVDVLGEDAVEAIKKSTSDVKAQLAEIRKQITDSEADKAGVRAETLHSDNVEGFMQGLRKLVPDLDVMNNDPGFNDWLREPGKNGVERLTVLQEDQKRFDYYRVSEFFIKYREAKKTGPKEVKDSINQHIGPAGVNTAESNTLKDPRSQGTIKQSEVNAFNKKVAKGDFKHHPEKAEAFEARVFKAMNEDKIIFDENPIY
jgi:hypothetical protein